MSNSSLLAVILLVLTSTIGTAQNVVGSVLSGGGEYSNGSVRAQWTLGQLVTGSFATNDVTVTHSIHQSQYVITSLDFLEGENSNIKVYPNPSSGFINIESFGFSVASVQILNMHGATVLKQESLLWNENETFDISQLQNGNYILKVGSADNSVYIFKIFKTSSL